MARSRSLPSDLFDDPDFFERDSDTQVILLGLVLLADDYGRGPAHPGLLARKCNKEQVIVERALGELETVGLLQCYSDGRHHYYFLRRWFEWESLSKPSRSRYPAPPALAPSCEPGASPSTGAGQFREKSGKSRNIRPEAEEEGRSEAESEEKKAKPGSGAGRLLLFPASAEAFVDEAAAPSASSESARDAAQLTEKVASILRLPPSEALARLVAEYQASPHLSLVGEADAAREYLDDPARNRRGQAMSLSFFRRWLKREEEAVRSRRSAQLPPGPADARETTHTSIAGTMRQGGGTGASGPENPYRALLQSRAQEVQHLFATTPAEARGAALEHLIQSIARRGAVDAAPV
jgi:hypothetical protein